MPAAIPLFVISLNVTRTGASGLIPRTCARCHEIASPSLSGSVARYTMSAAFASFLSSFIRAALSFLFSYLGSKLLSTSTPSFDLQMLLRNNPFRDISQLFSPSQATQLLPDGTNFSSSFPCRQYAGSNSPFKLFAYCRQFVYGGRLSPHPFNILSLLFYFVLAKRQCAALNSPAMYRFKFAFQTACAFLHLV